MEYIKNNDFGEKGSSLEVDERFFFVDDAIFDLQYDHYSLFSLIPFSISFNLMLQWWCSFQDGSKVSYHLQTGSKVISPLQSSIFKHLEVAFESFGKLLVQRFALLDAGNHIHEGTCID